MRTFKLLVLANQIDWETLPAKMEAVKAFYAPVCNLDIEIRHVSLYPTYAQYPDVTPLYVIDRGWYDVNLAAPNALQADLILFITKPGSVETWAGYMSYNNVGPWETTVFVNGGENDHIYMGGTDMGDAFTLLACHELSHAFYRIVGKQDDTHVHFPVNQSPYLDNPTNVLKDFDFGARYAVLEWLKDKLVSAATTLYFIQKRHIQTTV